MAGWIPWAEAVTKDEEIIERLVRLETKFEGLETKLESMETNLQRQIGELKSFMLWIGGVMFAGMFALFGFVLWDRRTALAPAISKNKELEKREESLEKALKEYALKEPRMAEALRRVGILQPI